MIRCIQVDDEMAAIENLGRVLEWYCQDEVEVIGTATDLLSAWSLVQELKPELVFLDVEMGKENGLMLLDRISKMEHRPYVIFTTGHPDYAIKALKQEAFDYLLKPIDPIELQQSISRLQVKMKEREAHRSNVDSSVEQGAGVEIAQPVPGEPSINLPMQNEVLVCRIADIIRCESASNYTRFFLKDGEKLLISRNLGSFENQLIPHGFYRSHKSHLINLAHLKSYVRTEGGYILMQDGAQIPLARNQRQEFFTLLGI